MQRWKSHRRRFAQDDRLVESATEKQVPRSAYPIADAMGPQSAELRDDNFLVREN